MDEGKDRKFMRILQICNHFPPTIGGSETHNFSIVKYLHERGYDVEVIALRDLPDILQQKTYEPFRKFILADEYAHPELPGVHIHNVLVKTYKFPQSHFTKVALWKTVRKAEKERGKFDVIEIHTAPCAIPLIGKRNILLSLHFFEFVCMNGFPSPAQCKRHGRYKCECRTLKKYIRLRITNFLSLRGISKIMVKYDYLKRNLIAGGVQEEKIVVIPHWIDNEKLQNQIQERVKNNILTQEGNTFTFGFLGRLDEFKGISLVVQALKLLLDKGTKAHLLVIGDGELRADLEAYCKEHRLVQNVTVAGYIPHEQVPAYLSLADAFVVSSSYDNYNWALLELMCTRKPLVATNTGGTCDILVDGYNAFLAAPTPSSIAEKMKQVVENPDLANKVAENALQSVREKHSLKNLKRYEELLIEIAKNEK